MNGVNFPPSIIERVIARRGTEHIFSDLDPVRTALVVVDLQNAFMDDAVGHAVCPAARDIVPAVNRLAKVTREAGGGVFWIKNTFDETCLTEWSVMQDISTPEGRARRAAARVAAVWSNESSRAAARPSPARLANVRAGDRTPVDANRPCG